MEWLGRYLPCEIAGTIGELGGAAVAYVLTGSTAAAAVTATVGASVGYYAAAYLTAMRWAYRTRRDRKGVVRLVVANLIALRSVAIEFGPAELIDSLLVRPAAFYIGPQIFGNVVVGWIFGKLVSDVAFYVFAIFSYERFKGLLVFRPQAEEVDGEPVTTVTAP